VVVITRFDRIGKNRIPFISAASLLGFAGVIITALGCKINNPPENCARQFIADLVIRAQIAVSASVVLRHEKAPNAMRPSWGKSAKQRMLRPCVRWLRNACLRKPESTFGVISPS
jgi:hypothetical protein